MHVHPSALQFVHYFPYSSALMSFSLHFFLLFPIFMDFLFSLVPPHSPMRCFSGIAASTAAPVSLARALPAMTMLALRTNPAKSGKASWDASIKVRKNGGKGDFRGKAGLGMTRGLTGEKREGEVEGTESWSLALRVRDGAILPMVSPKVSCMLFSPSHDFSHSFSHGFLHPMASSMVFSMVFLIVFPMFFPWSFHGFPSHGSLHHFSHSFSHPMIFPIRWSFPSHSFLYLMTSLHFFPILFSNPWLLPIFISYFTQPMAHPASLPLPDPCKSLRCRPKERCRPRGAQSHCIPALVATCWAWGDPHFRTFDGLDFDFQGTCTYTMAESHGNDPGLVPFRVEAKNDIRGGIQSVSYVSLVNVDVYGQRISFRRNEDGKVRVSWVEMWKIWAFSQLFASSGSSLPPSSSSQYFRINQSDWEADC